MSVFEVQQIDHVELDVPDRYEASAWYENVFGLKIIPDFEFWAEDSGGPLMIGSPEAGTKLALFTGDAPGFDPPRGFHRVAFRVDAAGFMTFLARLETLALTGVSGQTLTAADVVDHDKSWSIYFFDPYGYRFEITSYDYEKIAKALDA